MRALLPADAMTARRGRAIIMRLTMGHSCATQTATVWRPSAITRSDQSLWENAMSNDARTVFEAYKTTTLTFDCYSTLIDWESGACRALRDTYRKKARTCLAQKGPHQNQKGTLTVKRQQDYLGAGPFRWLKIPSGPF
jgi:hypothetical protein